MTATDSIALSGMSRHANASGEDDIIVMQTSDASSRYFDMMMLTARTARRYCEHHGLRYQGFIGLKRGNRAWHATYNRIDLLQELIQRDHRGWVLYVDADAWIVDMTFDLRGYLRDKQGYAMIAAPAGHVRDFFWNVNIGVMLFNLGHPFTRRLVRDWEAFLSRYRLERDAIDWNGQVPDDQGMFHQLLDKHADAEPLVLHADKSLLNSPWASFVRQAIRAENTDIDERLRRIAAEVEQALGHQAG
ncbi:hypothetical protein [Cupriavidus sp. WS]|uniref:hypothetical protein n=1 Tax=Cupriavidus sp. WS TaxID=1312922 RepID=UPI00037AEFBC|nr:hypothetical protein [Cupriavidus sp. WS]